MNNKELFALTWLLFAILTMLVFDDPWDLIILIASLVPYIIIQSKLEVKQG